MKNKLVSVIVPVYNAEKYLEKCLDSIINQTYENLEIILINDGSSDNSLNICKEYLNLDKRIKLIQQDNKGPSSARNLGLDISTGYFVIFVDSDDYISSGMIEKLVNNYKTDYLLGVRIKKCVKETRYKNLLCNVDEFINLNLKGFIDDHSGVLRYLFTKNNIGNLRFDDNLFFLEDMLFLIQYVMKIKKVEFIENEFYYYVDNDNSITRSNGMIKRKINSLITSFKKINVFTNGVYSELIDNKMVIILEKELRNVNDDWFSILDILPNLKYHGKSVRYIIFCYLINNKKIFLLHYYYQIRSLIKRIVR